jgi:hypothetical protein
MIMAYMQETPSPGHYEYNSCMITYLLFGI